MLNGLQCSVNITFFFFFGSVWHVESQFPDQGLNPQSLKWKRIALTTGAPGNSNIILICTGKPTHSRDSLYCNLALQWQSGTEPAVSPKLACKSKCKIIRMEMKENSMDFFFFFFSMDFKTGDLSSNPSSSTSQICNLGHLPNLSLSQTHV